VPFAVIYRLVDVALLKYRFFTGILLNIIDTVFICFAMDSDKHTATRPDVHEVCASLASSPARSLRETCARQYMMRLFFYITLMCSCRCFLQVYAKVPGVAKAIEAGCWTPTQAYSRPPQ
jgi:hypothetical protein